MAERTVTLGPEEGLHAGPAARFVKAAKGFAAEIVVIKGDREANAKSQLRVMQLGSGHGEEIVIRADGADADAAVEASAQGAGRRSASWWAKVLESDGLAARVLSAASVDRGHRVRV